MAKGTTFGVQWIMCGPYFEPDIAEAHDRGAKHSFMNNFAQKNLPKRDPPHVTEPLTGVSI